MRREKVCVGVTFNMACMRKAFLPSKTEGHEGAKQVDVLGSMWVEEQQRPRREETRPVWNGTSTGRS